VCGVKLRVLQGRVQVSLLLAFLLLIGLGFLIAQFSPVDRDSVGGKLRLFASLPFTWVPSLCSGVGRRGCFNCALSTTAKRWNIR